MDKQIIEINVYGGYPSTRPAPPPVPQRLPRPVQPQRKGQRLSLINLLLSGFLVLSFSPVGFISVQQVLQTVIPPSSPTVPSSDQQVLDQALDFVLKKEGGCQRWSSDRGNRFKGQIGHTCMGITPGVGWQHRKDILSEYFEGYQGHPANFTYHAHNAAGAKKFNQLAREIYIADYWRPAFDLKTAGKLHPALVTIWLDIAINSGPGTANRFLKRAKSSPREPVALAQELADQHLAFYRAIVARDSSQKVFWPGWSNRANARQHLLDQYK